MSNFKKMELDSLILKGVDKAGFREPFPIQERAIGPLLAGSDVIGQAKTGTGKTAAFGLPLLQAIDTTKTKVQALVLAPTRELAVQITNEIRKLGAYTGARLVTIYGGQSINVQIDALRRGMHAVVGTPGRVIDHIKRGTLRLDSAKFVVLDEADTMLDMGFIDDVEFILDSIPRSRQIALFSATMPQRILELAGKYMRTPERILIDSDEPSVDSLEQYYLVVKEDEKFQRLVDLLSDERPSSAIIFCKTKYGAHRLARNISHWGISAVPLHGDLSQNQRDHSMHVFRTGSADVLVATDVASRGIDIPQVECIVNYEVPQDPLIYFHRVGRTARAGKGGKAYTFVSREESGDFARVLRMTKAPIKPFRGQDYGIAFEIPPGDSHRWRRRRFGNHRRRRFN
jgi:ATP-dependent RNA helicase DeaD